MTKDTIARPDSGSDQASNAWDHSTRDEFFQYYAEASLSPEAVDRFRRLRDRVLEIRGGRGPAQPLDVLDIGCGAGTLCRVWAEGGHRVAGIDVNAPLIDLARDRAGKDGLTIDFRVGSATELPWPDGSFDVCCMPELLEHVAEWEKCLLECVRCLRRGGALYLTTSNKLCPVQQEFNLPLYSWYPGFLKRRFERLAVTTRPEIVNHATYPAVNWFSFYQLRRFLAPHGFRCLDRFDVLNQVSTDPKHRLVLSLIRYIPGLRLLGQMMTPGTIILAIRDR